VRGFLGVYAVLVVFIVFDGVEFAIIEGYPVTGMPVAIIIPTVLTAITL
jgi:hypothetical protein